MSNLTRIKNNQIVNSTIIASQKIAAGTITGSLFSSNVTVPGDLLISGNLFVLGTSAYTTIASTNTYVNDPLVVLNNGFAGTNTYDEGVVFNRGSLLNQAFIWSEFNKEFRLIGTTETGTAYGNVAVSNFANLHIGNLIVDYTSTLGNLIVGQFTATTANISTIYGDTLNVAGNVLLGLTRAAAINSTPIGNIAASTGAFTTLFASSQVTFSANTDSTNTTTGALIVNGGVGIGGNLFLGGNLNVIGNSFIISSNSGVFYGNAVGAGALYAGVIGYTPQDFTTIQSSGNADNYIQINLQNINSGQNASSDFVATADNGTQTDTFIDMGINSSTYNVAGYELSKPNDGYLYVHGNLTTGGGNLLLATFNENDIIFATAGLSTPNEQARFKNNVGLIISRTTASTTTTSGALQVAGGVGIAGNLNVGGNLVVNSPTLLNNSLTSTGIVTFNNTTNSTDASGTTGALRIAGGGSIAKDLWVGGNIYASNIFGVTHQIITVQDPLVYFDAANTFPYNYDIGFYSNFVGPNPIDNTGNVYQHTGVVRDNSDNTWKFFSNVRSEPDGTAITFDSATIFDPIRAGNLTLTYTQDSTSATTGSFKTAGGAGIGGNIFHTGTQLQTSASNYIFATTPTTVDAFKAASTLNVGANSGTLTIGNPTVVGTQSSQNLYNTTATTMNFAGDATTLVAGATSGLASIRNAVINFPNATSVVTDQTSLNLFNANVTTLNAGGAATALTLGATSGLASIRNAVINFPNATSYLTDQTDINIFNANVLSANILGTANNITIGSSLGFTTVRHNLEAQGILYAENIAEATSEGSGGLVVFGGAGIAGNLFVGNSAVFNEKRSTGTFQIKSSTSGNVALFANLSAGLGTSESVIIGGGNTIVQPGVTLKVSSTSTMMMPVGPTAARPSNLFGNVSYDVPGMIRFNTTINNLEFYDGSNWQVTGSSFTVISDRQFIGNVAGGFGNVDGTNTVFTLQAASTTAGTLVSINGVIQFPTLAYSVSGTTLTFTEPPAPDDVIDARIFTTTTTVTTLASGNGLNQFIAEETGAQIWTGSVSTIKRLEVDTAGNFNYLTGNKVTYDQTVVSVPNTNLTLLDSFSANSYTTSKYVISMKQGTGNVQAMEALLTQSTVGTTPGDAYVTTYGIVNTGNTMGTLAANVDISSSWTVKLWLIPNAGTAISNVKVMTTYIV